MIPERVAIRNFLTYGEDPSGGPVVFDFSGARLWSIGGDNGAGKSTVFDAIRYCLFGQHRGGSQNDGRLVRQGADGAELEFDFRYADALYRIRRTVTRTRMRNGNFKETKAVGASSYDAALDAWVPIAGTEDIRGLERWVRSLGLRPDVFNATVLLQQGGADKILTESPKDRFEIFSTIVDLAPYERLATAATSRRKDAAVGAKMLKERLAAIPAVSDEEVSAATARFDAEAEDLERALEEEKAAGSVLDGAKRAADLMNKLAGLAVRRNEIDAILADAATVETRFARHQILTAARTILTEAEAALADAEEADAQESSAQTELNGIDREALRTAKEVATSAVAEQERVRAELLSDADAIARALPVARGFIAARAEAESRGQAAAEAGSPAEWEEKLNRLKVEADGLDQQVAVAESIRDQVQTAKAVAQARATTLGEAIAGRRGAADEGTCSRCGQNVDVEHLARELAELEEKQAVATRDANGAEAEGSRVAAELARLIGEAKAATAACKDTEMSLQIARNAETEMSRATKALTTATEEAAILPSPWQVLLAGAAQEIEAEAVREQGLREGADQCAATLENLRQELDNATAALETADRRKSALTNVVLVARERAKGSRREAEAHLTGVDPALADDLRARRIAALEDLETEVSTLGDAPAAHARLINAGNDRKEVDAAMKAVTEDLDAVPVEQRIPVDEAEEASEAAIKRRIETQGLRDDAFTDLRDITAARKEHLDLTEQVRKAERTGRVAGRLAELLGRGGLQAQLLRQAVQGVETLANDTLSRISGGGLTVELRCGDDQEGSKLEVWVGDAASADEPLEANFVSGSQKFRVAVAIAAGLGQYLAGPEAVRSLIIDEGFGSLDEAGREVMIAELRSLAEHLERIVVVSHHADFSDPARFPNSFTLRKAGRHTEVSRRV